MEQDTKRKCKFCKHNCHCETIVCEDCKCGVCDCEERVKRPDWG